MTGTHKKQLEFIFDRPTAKPEWYWSTDLEMDVFRDGPLESFEFVEAFLADPGNDLGRFSDDQIAVGLSYIFNGAASDLAHNFRSAAVPHGRKTAALRSLFNLFSEVLAPRCLPKTSASAQVVVSELNNFCYMFWDVSPWSTWVEFNLAPDEDIVEAVFSRYKNMDEMTAGLYAEVAGVMRHCLYLGNPACVESGLHGLGHLATFLPKMAVPIIDEYLKTAKGQRPGLISYAKQARTGMIL